MRGLVKFILGILSLIAGVMIAITMIFFGLTFVILKGIKDYIVMRRYEKGKVTIIPPNNYFYDYEK